ncbi:murein hydrolase activator EnvC family protein [Paenibacillus sp. MMO-177]|uniref:murein hydrolase activator EnvC family protein n=1 Tax=Paenibacillus sp. MMO-177 TaxID=3081289 RepID=UPI003015905F
MVIATALLIQPNEKVEASTWDQINQEINSVQEQIQDTKKESNRTNDQLEEIQAGKVNVEQAIETVMAELNMVNDNLNAVQTRITSKEKELIQIQNELEEAKQRANERDTLLQSRMRLLYMNGAVSYVDVLLNATSFSDFIDRFDALHSILSRDRDLLEQTRKEKASIEETKLQAAKQLQEINNMYAKLETYKRELRNKENEKALLLARYEQKIEELEDISEQQEQTLILLANQASKLEAQKKQQNPGTKTYHGGKLGMPIIDYSRMSSPYGSRVHPVTGVKKMHTGMDFAASSGTEIIAAESGVVLLAQTVSGYGNTVIIDHGQGVWTLYAHIRNDGIKVAAGDKVSKGQKIAEVGMTGTATGNNLHFEVRINENAVNPEPYIQ